MDVKNRLLVSPIPRLLSTAWFVPALLGGLLSTTAHAEPGGPADAPAAKASPEGDEGDKDAPVETASAPGSAAVTPSPTGPAATTTTPTAIRTDGESPIYSDGRFGASLTLDTSVGIGTFVSDPQTNPLVVTSISPSGFYRITPELRATLGLSLTWYQVLGFDTSLPENEFLLSDISIGLAHSRIFNDPDSGFNLSGSLRVGLPTSLASQFQNRLFSLSAGFGAAIPIGPVVISYSLGFSKFFNLTATPTLDCEDFSSEEECIEGRDDNPNFGFESERRGPEVYLRGQGATSFSVTNGIDISWAIIDELALSVDFSISNAFGVRAFPRDDLSSENATAGRSQRDRLMSSIGLTYIASRHLKIGASLMTDTSQPFGASGDDFPVIFDFTRASDNITSINLSVTGSL